MFKLLISVASDTTTGLTSHIVDFPTIDAADTAADAVVEADKTCEYRDYEVVKLYKRAPVDPAN